MSGFNRVCCVFPVWLAALLILCGSLSCLNAAANKPSAAPPTGNPSEAQGKHQKLALLVGINDYQYVNKLKGTLNDVTNMRQVLVERFGFPDDDQHILVLKDEQATRDAILKAVEQHLIAKATPDSVVVFHFSGHGSQRVDDNGDEVDGFDETLVTYDSGREDPHPNLDITDDELYDLLNRLANKTPNVTFIFDSCHSGTITRGAGLARTVERDNRPPAAHRAAPTAAARGAAEGKSGLHPVNARYAVISGSATDEYSYELGVDGNAYGALTWYLTDQIRRAGKNATYRDVMDLVKARVTAMYPGQHPQLEGPGDNQLIFSDRSLETAPYVLVKAGPGGTVTLEAGQVQGVTKGSIYDVYPPGTKSFGVETKRVAQIEVTDVDVISARAKIREGKIGSDVSRAVEREHRWPDPVLRVYFRLKDPARPQSGPSETLMKVKKELETFKHIAAVPTESGYDLLLREQKDENTGKSEIITEGGDPTEISPRVAVTDPDAVSHVVTQVKHWAKWFNILQITNRTPELGLDLELEPVSAAGSRPGPSDREVNLTLFEGERFTVRITNTSNRDLYVALLDLSSDGSVDVVYPARGAQEFVAPGKTWTKGLSTFVPDGRDSVRDILKVVATTEHADFSFLKQAAVRGGPRLAATRGKPANPLEELLANAALGTTRGVADVDVGSWATLDKVLEVHRSKSP